MGSRSAYEGSAGGLLLDTPALAVALETSAATVQFVQKAERDATCARHLAGVASDALFTPGDVDRRCAALVKELRGAPVDFTIAKPLRVVEGVKKSSATRSFTITRR